MGGCVGDLEVGGGSGGCPLFGGSDRKFEVLDRGRVWRRSRSHVVGVSS